MQTTTPPVQNLTIGTQLHGFELERVVPIPEIKSTAYVFRHLKTDARLLHLFNDDPNNLFSIAFRTPVHNSTGVAHILEHSVLCGSKRFPVKDPFQEMLKGSLQTFLNALTYPDKTVYPVSSQVKKDFFNLVDVYCDAVLNPILSENTFYQEGWHFDVDDESGPVGIKGIVYNEMKGVFSDFSSHVDRKTLAALFPDTTYSFESGGEPEHIPDLTYEQFRDFHRRYYHPSNSYIFLYGNLGSAETLAFLDGRHLSHFDKLQVDSHIEAQPLWTGPRRIETEAPAPREDDGTATVALAWIFGTASDPVSTLTGSILAHYLLGTESSPLKRALVDSGLGEDLDDISGFETDLVQTVFVAGLRKTRREHAETIRTLVLDTLRKQADEGLDDDLLEGAIRQIEFHLREVSGGHFPYNLRLADRCYRSWIYGGDPVAHLAFEQPINRIKEQRKLGQVFFRKALRESLLDNSHQLLSIIVGSSEMGKKLEQQTELQAARLSASFGPDQKKRFRELTRTLVEQQKKPPVPEALATLPRLHKSDLPLTGTVVATNLSQVEGVPLYAHPVFTSGIAYLDIGFDLRSVPAELLPYLPIYSELLTRCGAGSHTYEQMAKRIALSTGGIDSAVSCKTVVGTAGELFFETFFFGKCLLPRFGEMLDIFRDLLLRPDLTNQKQIRDILLEERNGLMSSVVGAGHNFAIARASSQLCASRAVEERLGGISQLRFLEALVRGDRIGEIAGAMEQLHGYVVNRAGCVVSLTTDDYASLTSDLARFVDDLPGREVPAVVPHSAATPAADRPVGVEIPSAVNFVARAWPLPPAQPSHAGTLFLLARNLSTGYLWDKVRVEGGAYGGMSVVSVAHPVFACASYRDPNLKQTLEHFEAGLQAIAAGISPELVEQSIIGSIGRIDAPRTPHAQGFGETMDLLVGYTPEFRQELREAVLGATSESLGRAAASILSTRETSVAVLGGAASFDTAKAQGLELLREPLLEGGSAEAD